MKVRAKVWATTLLISGVALCVYRVSSQESDTPPLKEARVITEAEKQRDKTYADHARKSQENYRARLNNGSVRQGLKIDELPKEVRQEAARLARQYETEIYPKLKKFVDEHDGRLPLNTGAVPELRPYMEDAEYKGTGPHLLGRGTWTIGGGQQRLDGTVVLRDVYSKNSPDLPHDIWANNVKFATQVGKGSFVISGWDDGRATFDLLSRNFYGEVKNFYGETELSAATPGQAGIPPYAVQGLDKWQDEQSRIKAQSPAAPTTTPRAKAKKN